MLIYVAGPMSTGSYMGNIRKGIDAAEALWQLGHTPIVPHLSFTWQMTHPHTWEEWLDHDLRIVAGCDAVYRIPGVSPGADVEVQFALDEDITVYYSLLQVPRVERTFELVRGYALETNHAA